MHDRVVSLPALSTAVVLTVFSPALLVSIATVPLASLARPDCASEARNVALAGAPTRADAGQLISRLGGVASTCTVRQPGAETLPALSATVPHAVCEPVVANVSGAESVDGLTPLPALPSDRLGSPLLVNETVTLPLYQPPPPA